MRIILPFTLNFIELILKDSTIGFCLAIRMTAPIHNMLAEYVKMNIMKEIYKISNSNNSSSKLAKGNSFNDSAPTELEDNTKGHPDIQF